MRPSLYCHLAQLAQRDCPHPTDSSENVSTRPDEPLFRLASSIWGMLGVIAAVLLATGLAIGTTG